MVEEGDRVKEPFEDEGVEVYEEYACYPVGTLRRMHGIAPLLEGQPGMLTVVEAFIVDPASFY